MSSVARIGWLSAAVVLFLPACSCDGNGGVSRFGPGGGDGGGDGVFGLDTTQGPEDCVGMRAVLRDFRAEHPDFEDYLGDHRGIVATVLGSDLKPVYALGGPGPTTTGPGPFDQWYRDVDGVNMAFEIPLPLTQASPGVFVFDNPEFFPLDGRGWPGEERNGHNFHFTTEVHTSFRYRGGEVFTFRGDDDVFAFVNGRLALDLGGVHGAEQAMINFDAQAAELGITVGGTYRFDIFHAERHTTESNFRVETSIECFLEPPPLL